MNPFSALVGLGRFILIVVIASLVAAFFIGRASAAPVVGLVVTCRDPAAANQLASKCGLPPWPGAQPHTFYSWPQDDTQVRTGRTWDEGTAEPVFRYKRWADVLPTEYVDTCKTAIEPDTPSPHPWSAADLCKNWESVLKSSVAVVTDLSKFEASSLGGVAPVSTVLSWDVSGVTTCAASGSWTGTKTPKGSQTISGLTVNATYTLTCTGNPQTGQAALSWSIPTSNVDGSPLTDLAGYRVVYGTAANQLTQTISIPNATAVAYTVTGLTPGQTWYFAMRAYTTAGAESANSGTVSKDIAGSPGKVWARSINVAVSKPPTVPNPPAGLTVKETTAFRLDQQPDAPLLVAVGTVAVAVTQCTQEAVTAKDARTQELRTVNRVSNAAVKLDRNRTRPNVALATCG